MFRRGTPEKRLCGRVVENGQGAVKQGALPRTRIAATEMKPFLFRRVAAEQEKSFCRYGRFIILKYTLQGVTRHVAGNVLAAAVLLAIVCLDGRCRAFFEGEFGSLGERAFCGRGHT